MKHLTRIPGLAVDEMREFPSRTGVSMKTTEHAATRGESMAMIVGAFVVVIMFTALWVGQLI